MKHFSFMYQDSSEWATGCIDPVCRYIQSNVGLYIDISKARPPGVPKNVLAISIENFQRELAAMGAAMRGEDNQEGNGGSDILVPEVGAYDLPLESNVTPKLLEESKPR
jgi:hypothetical protein